MTIDFTGENKENFLKDSTGATSDDEQVIIVKSVEPDVSSSVAASSASQAKAVVDTDAAKIALIATASDFLVCFMCFPLSYFEKKY